MKKSFSYWASCPDLPSDLAHVIPRLDGVRKIAYSTFVRNVDTESVLFAWPGLRGHWSKPRNWFVDFWKGATPSGVPLYFVTWSGYEIYAAPRSAFIDIKRENALAKKWWG